MPGIAPYNKHHRGRVCPALSLPANAHLRQGRGPHICGPYMAAKSSNLPHTLPFDQIKGDDFVYGAAGFFNAV